MIVLGALPLLALLLIWLRLSSSRGWREALIDAAVIWGVLVAVSTEALSLIGQFRFPLVAALWVVASCIAAAADWRKGDFTRLRVIKRGSTRVLAIAALPFAVITAMTLLVALVAPPNTWDSMSYHMARVAHWVDQGSVNNYPTETLRQLFQPPWAEYAIAHFQILSGGDHLANIVQWSSMIGSTVGVSLIAQRLGAPIAAQYLAALIAATLPMGILQSTSTQNDYVESFWLVCAVVFVLRLRDESGLEVVLGLAASLGLAVLTKGTAYIYAVPIIILGAWWLIRRYGLRVWQPSLLIALAVLALNLGAWGRNISTFGSAIGPPEPLANAVFSVPELASNIVRDTSNQIGTPFAIVNGRMQGAIRRIHLWLGISQNDARTTYPGVTFQVNALSNDEDSTPSPLQFLLLVVASIMSLLYIRRRKTHAIYAGGLILAFVLFSLVLRWQPWLGRLELPLLVVGAPVTAAAITAVSSRRVIVAIAAVLSICAVPWLLGPWTRPLVGPSSILTTARSDIYFVAKPTVEDAYLRAASQAHASGCHVIGIVGAEDTWEYPLWVFLGPGYRVVPIQPAPGTANLAGGSPTPCLVFHDPT